MAILGIRESTPKDFEFCWKVLLENISSQGQPKRGDQEKKAFAEKWNARSNCIVDVDGEGIGWFACIFDAGRNHFTVEDLYFRIGNRGVPPMVLNIIANDAAKHGRRVYLSLPKSHSAVSVFKSQAFPIESESDSHTTVDVATVLERSNGWGAAGNPDLPWNKV